jgi:DNA-binding HxlR family transcriptional regulator
MGLSVSGSLVPRGARQLSRLGMRDKILSACLKQLESKGILIRRVEPGPPIRAEYELTRKGRAFRKLAAAIQRWGHELVDPGPARPTRTRLPSAAAASR